MIRFSLLGSGSSGNTAFVISPQARILVDCGLSFRQLQLRATQLKQPIEGLDAVFITHEHTDHVAGLRVLAKRFAVPIFMTAETRAALPDSAAGVPGVEVIEAGDSVRIKDLEIKSFSISHDAADPVSYVVCENGAKLGFATDLGHVSHVVRRSLEGANGLVLESNYCPQLLRNGAYPAQVQHRIRSRIGHLSNHDMCSLLSKLLHDRLRTVVLMHLSENNNAPALVHRLASEVLRGRNIHLHLAEQDKPTPLFEVIP